MFARHRLSVLGGGRGTGNQAFYRARSTASLENGEVPEKKADPPLDARNALSADYGGQHYVILSSSSYWRSARKVCAVPPQALWQCKSSPQCACGPLWTTCIEFFHRTPACALDPVPPRFTHPPGACALMSGVVRAMLAVRVKGFALTRREVQPGLVWRRSSFW